MHYPVGEGVGKLVHSISPARRKEKLSNWEETSGSEWTEGEGGVGEEEEA